MELITAAETRKVSLVNESGKQLLVAQNDSGHSTLPVDYFGWPEQRRVTSHDEERKFESAKI